MNIFNDIKQFLFSNNIIDSCIGFYLAVNMKKFIDSFSNNIVTPLLYGKILKVNQNKMYFVLLNGENKKNYESINDALNDGAIVINYGEFINSSVDILISTISLYIIMKILYKIK